MPPPGAGRRVVYSSKTLAKRWDCDGTQRTACPHEGTTRFNVLVPFVWRQRHHVIDEDSGPGPPSPQGAEAVAAALREAADRFDRGAAVELYRRYEAAIAAAGDSPDDDPCVELLYLLLPELQRALFAPSS